MSESITTRTTLDDADVSCDSCGDPATQRWDEGEPYHFWTGQPRYVDLCVDCYNARDNEEPPDPDGEEIFRDYPAERRDALDAARKLK